MSEGLLAMQVLDGLLRWGRAAGDGCVEVHRQWAVAGNVRLLLWCRCWYRGTHVGAVVVLCIQSEEAVARCDLAVCVLLHVWSAVPSIGNEGYASVCTALEQNKTLTSFGLSGMLCSGVCSVQVIGVLWCKCSGAVLYCPTDEFYWLSKPSPISASCWWCRRPLITQGCSGS